jgi:hypothetical protein
MSFSYKDFCVLFFGKYSFKKSCSIQKIFQKSDLIIGFVWTCFAMCYKNDFMCYDLLPLKFGLKKTEGRL